MMTTLLGTNIYLLARTIIASGVLERIAREYGLQRARLKRQTRRITQFRIQRHFKLERMRRILRQFERVFA
jgi:hypothetical protein